MIIVDINRPQKVKTIRNKMSKKTKLTLQNLHPYNYKNLKSKQVKKLYSKLCSFYEDRGKGLREEIWDSYFEEYMRPNLKYLERAKEDMEYYLGDDFRRFSNKKEVSLSPHETNYLN